MASVISKYASRKAIFDLQFVGNSNGCHICNHFIDIPSRIVRDIDLDLQNGPISKLKMLTESQNATSYLMAIVLFIYTTISELFTVEKWMTWPLEWVKDKSRYANEKPYATSLFVGNGNICAICHHFRDIHSRSVHNLDLSS